MCRLDQDEVLRALEMTSSGPENILALRLLYGCLTYFDSLPGRQSPAGTYGQFLVSLDWRVRGELRPDDAFEFLDLMTDQTSDTPRAVFVLLDGFNAAAGTFPVSNILSALASCHSGRQCRTMLLLVVA